MSWPKPISLFVYGAWWLGNKIQYQKMVRFSAVENYTIGSGFCVCKFPHFLISFSERTGQLYGLIINWEKNKIKIEEKEDILILTYFEMEKMLVVVGDELQGPLVAIIGDGKLQLENPVHAKNTMTIRVNYNYLPQKF